MLGSTITVLLRPLIVTVDNQGKLSDGEVVYLSALARDMATISLQLRAKGLSPSKHEQIKLHVRVNGEYQMSPAEMTKLSYDGRLAFSAGLYCGLSDSFP
jgi:hypothetical protein